MIRCCHNSCHQIPLVTRFQKIYSLTYLGCTVIELWWKMFLKGQRSHFQLHMGQIFRTCPIWLKMDSKCSPWNTIHTKNRFFLCQMFRYHCTWQNIIDPITILCGHVNSYQSSKTVYTHIPPYPLIFKKFLWLLTGMANWSAICDKFISKMIDTDWVTVT